MLTGTLTINGIDDKELRTLLTVKIEHEESLVFNPNQLQPFTHPPQQPYRPGQPPQPAARQEQRYNNAVVSWNQEAGLKAVKELLHRLTEHDEKREQAV
ncbi:MAG TPA: hypothetical protein VK819_16505 [Acidobacteriaceae bacterium]|jgi:hypothetical protein|nr:hypothetical protein [Acidobacteriaceae bacterium]